MTDQVIADPTHLAIVHSFERGQAVAKIAASYQQSASNIYRILDRYGVKRHRNRPAAPAVSGRRPKAAAAVSSRPPAVNGSTAEAEYTVVVTRKVEMAMTVEAASVADAIRLAQEDDSVVEVVSVERN